MKNRITLLVLAFITAAFAAQAQTNLLKNGGFEQSSTSFLGTTFDSWDKIPSTTASAQTDDKVEGNQSMQITNATAAQREFYQDLTSSAALVEGATYDLSFWCKKTVAKGDEDIIFTAYWTCYPPSSKASDTVRAVVNATDSWSQFKTQITCPAKAQRLTFDVKVATGTTTLFDDCQVTVAESDPDKPVMTATPASLPAFEAFVGETKEATIKIHSENLTNLPTISVEHIKGAAFVSYSSMLPKNTDTDVTIAFKPQEAGNFESKLTIHNSEAGDIVINLYGTATQKGADEIDWQTEAKFDLSNPLSYLDEPFNNAIKNKTLLIDGWQNIAPADARPWWGYVDQDNNSYAKATAYQSNSETNGEWTLRLITPALDFKNAATKVFGFNVMAQYISDEIENPTSLEIYYIDATGATVYEEKIDAPIPATNDENDQWIPILIDFTGQQFIADVFFMEFRFSGPNGKDGAVVYYIDDVSWGKLSTGLQEVKQLDNNMPMYNLLGIEVDSNYRGIVIQNGQKYLLK